MAVCNNKVITSEIGQLVFSSIITLLAIHYTFELKYNPATQQVLEFFQEKLICDRLSAKKKISTAYSNILRAVNCIEQNLGEGQNNDDISNEDADNIMTDETQEYIDF